jgi:Cytosine/adenosine deaminases
MDEKYMRRAIEVAKAGLPFDEVPVGAVIVKDGEIIAEAHNMKETENSAVAHAEIVALTKAVKVVGNWRLYGCDMYVTLEPCAMCAGAVINSHVDNVYFGAYDEKAGCCGTLYNLPQDVRFNHRAGVMGGILESECAALLSDYFKTKRKPK